MQRTEKVALVMRSFQARRSAWLTTTLAKFGFSLVIIVCTINTFSAYIYDSVLQWAIGVNKTIEQGYAPDDGFQISKNIFNLVYEGMEGTVTINEVGDNKPPQR